MWQPAAHVALSRLQSAHSGLNGFGCSSHESPFASSPFAGLSGNTTGGCRSTAGSTCCRHTGWVAHCERLRHLPSPATPLPASCHGSGGEGRKVNLNVQRLESRSPRRGQLHQHPCRGPGVSTPRARGPVHWQKASSLHRREVAYSKHARGKRSSLKALHRAHTSTEAETRACWQRAHPLYALPAPPHA